MVVMIGKKQALAELHGDAAPNAPDDTFTPSFQRPRSAKSARVTAASAGSRGVARYRRRGAFHARAATSVAGIRVCPGGLGELPAFPSPMACLTTRNLQQMGRPASPRIG